MTAVVRLRQVAVVVADLDGVVADLHAVLGLDVGYHDPAMERIRLRNAVLPVGEEHLEVVASLQPGTPADRFRQRRGGDSGYMLIFQTDDHPAHQAVVAELGVRIVARFDAEGFTNMQLHPADTGGAFFEIDQQEGAQAWHPAGPDWRRAVRTDLVTGIRGATVACTDPAAVAERWSRLLLVPVTEGPAGPRLGLEGGEVRFRSGIDDGLVAVDVATRDPAEVLRRAAARGLPASAGAVTISGIELVLVSA